MVRERAVESAIQDFENIQSKNRIEFGLRPVVGTKKEELSSLLRAFPSGAPIELYRQSNNKWEGLHTFVSIEGETVIVQTRGSRRIFRSNCVRSWNKARWNLYRDLESSKQDDVGKITCGVTE